MNHQKCLLQSHIIEYLLDKCYVEISETRTVVQSVAFKDLEPVISHNMPIRCKDRTGDCIHCAVEAHRDERGYL